MYGALIADKEVPAKYHVIYKVTYDTTIHPKVPTLNAKGYIDDATCFHSAPINADGVALMWENFILVEIWMAAKKGFADTGALATSVAEGGTGLTIHCCQDFCFIFRLRLFRVRWVTISLRVKFVFCWVKFNFCLSLLLTG